MPSFKDQIVLEDQKHGDIFMPTPAQAKDLSDAILNTLGKIYGGGGSETDESSDFAKAQTALTEYIDRTSKPKGKCSFRQVRE